MKFLAEALTSTTGPAGTRQPGRARPGARRPHPPCPRSAQRCDDRMGTGEQYWPVTSARGAAANRPLPAHVHSITSYQPLPGRHHRRTQQPPPYHPQQPHIPTPQEANTQLITTIHDASAVRNCSRRLPVAQPERRPGASRGNVGDRQRRRVPRSRPRSSRRSPVTALPFRWSPGAGAGTHSLRTPTPSHSAGGHWGSTVGSSHSPTASSASAVPALVGPVSGSSHFPAASASSPPNVVSSCLTISACFFSLRVTLAANTAAEATMIARGT